MTSENRLSEQELENLIFQIICWMKKWALWDASAVLTRKKVFSSSQESTTYEPSGWQNCKDVWVGDYDLTEMSDDIQEALDLYVLIVECGNALDLMLEQGIYTADFDCLPDAARITLLRNIALFESSEDWWYEAYLEAGVRFDQTEFDSFDEYWELESVNQDEFKLELLTERLCTGRPMFLETWEKSYAYNKEVAKLVLGELDEILNPYLLQYRTASFCDLFLLIG